MPYGAVQLRPGVNTQRTLSDNEAGVSQSNLIRYKEGLLQKYGGWQAFYPFQVSSTPVREMHAWQGLVSDKHLAIGSLTNLVVITAGSASDIMPQTNTTNPTPSFSVSSGSNVVTVVDAGSSVSTFDVVYFNTQVSVGGGLLQGAYKVNSVGGSSTYTILAQYTATVTASSSGVVPLFTTSSGSAIINVVLPDNGYQSIPGLFEQFIAPTSVGGLTIQGPYQISSVIDTSSFTITATNQSTGSQSRYMNSNSSTVGVAQLLYYISAGPPPTAGGYGVGLYGAGAYGSGTAIPGGSGTPITATDWTMDNWGELLIACPTGGPIYTWSPDSGFTTATVIQQAPFFNGGIFVSMPQQILVAWASTESTGVHDPLVVRWSNSGDYTNWTVSNQTTAGSFHIPTGSQIMGGMQAPSQGLIWTDLDVWAMSYVGGIVVFNFTRIGSGCGLIGPHAAGILGGNVYWCGINNFFMLGQNGVAPMPCTVWDFIFQNLSKANQSKIRAAPNSTFSEMAWFFPSAAATEDDSYVKFNQVENEWDYGSLSRTAWIDTTILGNPIGVDNGGIIYQHETGNDAATIPMNASFQSGYWSIAQGNEVGFVAFIIPDFRWGSLLGTQNATVQITFLAVNFLGDTPTSYGPYTVTSATEFINTRIRGRFMAVLVQSSDLGTFWRLGRIRFRWATSGRR